MLSRALFQANHTARATGSATSSQPSPTASTSASPSSTLSSSPYLPPLLESLVTTPHIPYPVFGLALSPPPANVSSPSTSSAKPTSTPRFSSSYGSLTLGGVSSLYILDRPGSDRTLEDIEWHQVIPFGRATNGDGTNETDGSTASNANVSTLSTSGSPTSSGAYISATEIGPQSSTAPQKRQTVPNALDSRGTPASLAELADEAYLYWAIRLNNITVNGTDIDLESNYAALGIPPVAMLDVGFNGISGPMDQVAKLFGRIPSAREVSTGQWAAPCDTKMTIAFSFG